MKSKLNWTFTLGAAIDIIERDTIERNSRSHRWAALTQFDTDRIVNARPQMAVDENDIEFEAEFDINRIIRLR